MIIVDTSALIDLFQDRATQAAEELARLEAESVPFAIPGFCCQEVLQGARDGREWRLLAEYLGTQRILLAQDGLATHLEAARIYYDCRRKGITVRSTVDCYVAQLVLEADGILLHGDEDYERIREVRPLRTLA